MIKRVKKWFQDQNNITRKTAGLAEKEISVQMKFDTAMSILNNRREKNVPVEYERRRHTNGFPKPI